MEQVKVLYKPKNRKIVCKIDERELKIPQDLKEGITFTTNPSKIVSLLNEALEEIVKDTLGTHKLGQNKIVTFKLKEDIHKLLVEIAGALAVSVSDLVRAGLALLIGLLCR